MKRKTPLLPAFILGTATLALQLPWSVPQADAGAREILAFTTADFASYEDAEESEDAEEPPQNNIASEIESSPESPAPRSTQSSEVGSASSASSEPSSLHAGVGLRPRKRDPLLAVTHPDIQPHHQLLARQVLSMLPESCQEKLESFYVVYDDPKHRGAAGRGVIIMNGQKSQTEFTSLLLHEMGHFWELTCLEGTPETGTSGFLDGRTVIFANDPSAAFYSISWESQTKRRKNAQARDFASGYAYSTDPFEDLAETVVYYALQRDAFRTRARANPVMAQKFAWMETHFPKSEEIAVGSPWNGVVVWNAAKIPYTWIASTGL